MKLPNTTSGGFDAQRLAQGGVVGLLARLARDREGAGQAEFVLEEMPDAARISFLGDDAKDAVPKKSWVTERHRSQIGLIVVCFRAR